MDGLEWKIDCLLAKQKCEHLQEKLNGMTQDRDYWRKEAEQLKDILLKPLRNKNEDLVEGSLDSMQEMFARNK
jgi:hypothetical protein